MYIIGSYANFSYVLHIVSTLYLARTKDIWLFQNKHEQTKKKELFSKMKGLTEKLSDG